MSRCRPSGWPRRGLAGSQAGQVVVWVAVMMPFFLSLVGLAADGGLVLASRRELQNVADSAARVGAMQIDQSVYRASSGQTVVLNAARARQAAAQYLVAQDPTVSATISSDRQRVVVQASRDMPTSFLRLAGIGSVHVGATSVAQPRYGIAQASGG